MLIISIMVKRTYIQIDVETCVLCDGCYCSWHSFRFHELLRACKHPSRNHCTIFLWIPNRWCRRSVKLYMRLVFFQLWCFGFFFSFFLFSYLLLFVALVLSIFPNRSLPLFRSLVFFLSISCRYLARVARIMKWAKNTNIHNENKLIASEEKKSATHKTAFETVLEMCLPIATCAYVSVTRAPFEYWWLM